MTVHVQGTHHNDGATEYCDSVCFVYNFEASFQTIILPDTSSKI